MRVENIGDKFDTDYKGATIADTSITIDLEEWALRFFDASNKKAGVVVNNVTFSELSLTANQPISDVISSKTKWKTTVDDSSREPKLPKDVSSTVIVLPQQKIRVFRVVYNLGKSAQEEKTFLY